MEELLEGDEAFNKAVDSPVSCTRNISKFFVEKGFGFVTPDDGTDDVFVHVKDNPLLASCQVGNRVRLDLAWDDRKGNLKGVNLNWRGMPHPKYPNGRPWPFPDKDDGT